VDYMGFKDKQKYNQQWISVPTSQKDRWWCSTQKLPTDGLYYEEL
jgi:hypothetical protein